MTPEQNKLIFDYCGFKIGWGCKRLNSELKQNCIKSENPVLLHCLPDDAKPCIYYYDEYRELDGNDILEAVKMMENKEDLFKFENFSINKWNEVNPKESPFSYLLP